MYFFVDTFHTKHIKNNTHEINMNNSLILKLIFHETNKKCFNAGETIYTVMRKTIYLFS